MEYIMIEKDKINGKEVYHRCSTKREENEGSRQWTYYICDNCKEHPSNSTYLGISTQHYIINRQKENKHIFCTDKEYQEKKVKKQMNNDKGSNGQMNYTSGQGGGASIYTPPLRYRGDTVYTSDYVDGLKKEIEELKKYLEFNNFKKTSLDSQLYTENIHLKERCQSQSNDITELTKSWENSKKSLNYNLKKVEVLEDENNLLKTQLAELHQANVNLFNEGEKLKKNLKATDAQYNTLMIKQDAEIEQLKEDVKILNREVAFWKNSFNSCVNLKISAEDTCSNLSIKLNKFQKERASYNKGLDELHQVILNQNKEIKDLKEQLEIKETINQDLVKKYQLLEEEIQAYDINMLELVESYKKLEQDYNDSTERLKIKSEVLSNLTAHTNQLEYKYKELEQEVNQLNSILKKETFKIKFANLFPERFIKLPFNSFCNPEIIAFLAEESFKEKYIQYTIKISEKEFK